MPRVSNRMVQVRMALMALSVGVLGVCNNAAAQQPTDDQRDAIKANCRSDFLSLCTGVPRGGAEALQCLKDNVAKLSSGCQQAVKPLIAAVPAPPAPAPAPAGAAPTAPPASAPAPAAAAAPPTAAAPAATPPAPAPVTSVPKSAVPPAAAATSPATAPAKPVAAPPSEKSAATPPAPAPQPVIVATPFQVLRLVRTECRAEYQAYCLDADVGGGRVLSCLQANMASLSPVCSSAIAAMAR